MPKRTLSFRSAISLTEFGQAVGGPGNLEALIRQLHATYTTIPNRRVLVDGQVIEGRHTQDMHGSLALHLVTYTVDDPVSVVPIVEGTDNADLDLLPPPEGSEFLDGEIMLIIAGNDIALCRSGASEKALSDYVTGLSERSALHHDHYRFIVRKRADVDQLALIREEGVKSIRLNSVAHSASIDRLQRTTVKEKFIGAVVDELRELLGIEEDIPADAENLKAEVLITFDKRNGTEIDQAQLSHLAELALNDEEEGFTIETLLGKKIRSEDLLLSKRVDFEPYGKSIRHDHAWQSLLQFYRELNTPQAQA